MALLRFILFNIILLQNLNNQFMKYKIIYMRLLGLIDLLCIIMPWRGYIANVLYLMIIFSLLISYINIILGFFVFQMLLLSLIFFSISLNSLFLLRNLIFFVLLLQFWLIFFLSILKLFWGFHFNEIISMKIILRMNTRI